jgi:hypothetical protein
MTQWKFVEATYTVRSVFLVPADWDNEKISVKWNKIEYDGLEVHPVWDASESELKHPDKVEITADGVDYDSSEFETDDFQIQK